MGYRRWVGSVELVSLTDGQGRGAPTAIFPTSISDVWPEEFPELIDGNGLIHPRYGSVALRSEGKLIVVDTGAGSPEGRLLGELDSKVVNRDEVDLVVLTHLHGDHIGGNLIDGKPAFPNARYLVSRADWDYWTAPNVLNDNSAVQEQAAPLEGLNVLDLIEGEFAVTGELTTLPTPGHTPGHISLVIQSAGERGFILGDVAHSPAQAEYTDWSSAFDIDPEMSLVTRRAIFDRLEADGSLISAGHMPEQGFGRLVREGGRRFWKIA
ncbi:MAG: MBL fold metallo-hydrolase [SAR202 cluster bacterium]|jgi:glyoxylase-like metal-dependent hydrolase (beta-lactamase superfamily II)|nr:MBL fold metallo-hydrolase [SAR202 cluster bacterium]